MVHARAVCDFSGHGAHLNDQELAVLLDARLGPDAARVVLYVAALGPGMHLITRAQLAPYLAHGGEKRVKKAIEGGRAAGWLIRQDGGRGGFKLGISGKTTAPESVVSPACQKNTSPQGGHSLETTAPESVVSGTVVVVGDVVVDPPIVPPEVGHVSERADELIDANGDRLAGCRDSLRDYLALRVAPAIQRHYVGSLLGWLNGTDGHVWTRPDGSKLPAGQRPALLGRALNELATADETKRKWPPGDVQNLRNKIDAILKERPATNGERTGGKRGGSGGGSDPRGTRVGNNERFWGRSDGGAQA